jgi:hypothetical protein
VIEFSQFLTVDRRTTITGFRQAGQANDHGLPGRAVKILIDRS